MKNKFNISKKAIIYLSIAFVAGILVGLMATSGDKGQKESLDKVETKVDEEVVWTCSMHPRIRQDEPGKCPICAMDLIPLSKTAHGTGEIDPNALQMTESAAKLADIQTVRVKRSMAEKELHLLGKVEPAEDNIVELTARYNGRIEELQVNFTGQHVRKGQLLAKIYSPNLVTAQRELLETARDKKTNPSLYESSKQKLKFWDISSKQIEEIEASGQPIRYFKILSPVTGTVMKRHVARGDYVNEGEKMFEVTDLSRVWVMLEAHEKDLYWLDKGLQVHFKADAHPGKTFSGKISYIDPFIDLTTRVSKIRVPMNNTGMALKPGTFVRGRISTPLDQEQLLIPKSAVLWTGQTAVVYVKDPAREQPVFHYREIELGPLATHQYTVMKGLQEGEEIAMNGVFKIDAAAQLAGKTSMMNPTGGIGFTEKLNRIL